VIFYSFFNHLLIILYKVLITPLRGKIMNKLLARAIMAIFVGTLFFGLIGCDDSKNAPPGPPSKATKAADSPDDSEKLADPEPKPRPPAGPAPNILQFLPSGPVPSLNQIVVAFDQPMVALGQFDQVPAGALTIEPPIKGDIRWLNEYVLAFVPEKPLLGSLNLKAKVKAGLKSLAGGALAEDAETMINLPPIDVASFSPIEFDEPQTEYRPAYQVLFNQELDFDSLNDKTLFTAKAEDGTEIEAKAVWTKPKNQPYSQRQGLWVAEARPDRAMPFNAELTLKASPGLISLAGPEPLAEELLILREKTAGPLKVAVNRWPESLAPDPNAPIDPTDAVTLISITRSTSAKSLTRSYLNPLTPDLTLLRKTINKTINKTITRVPTISRIKFISGVICAEKPNTRSPSKPRPKTFTDKS
jgi:hypothetical protein